MLLLYITVAEALHYTEKLLGTTFLLMSVFSKAKFGILGTEYFSITFTFKSYQMRGNKTSFISIYALLRHTLPIFEVHLINKYYRK